MDQQKKYREPKDTLWGKCLTTFIAIVFAVSTLTIIPLAGATINPDDGQAAQAAADAAKQAANEAEGKTDTLAPQPEVPANQPIETAAVYATQAELDAAFEAVGNVDPTADDMTAFIAAMDAYLAVYNRLSPEDQAARADEKAYVQSYRDQVAAGQPDEEINTTAAKWHTITLVPASTNSYSSKITSAKVRVGQKVNGYEVTSVSGTTIKVKAWGDLYGDFFLPRAADLWNGAVKSDYVTWAGTGSSQKTEGSSAMLPQSNASAYYYFNTAGSVSGGGSESYYWKFTLKYDANGGSGAPAAQTGGSSSKYDRSYDFTLSGTIPTRDGYTFLGWATAKYVTDAGYQPRDTYTMWNTTDGYNGGSKTETLYAVWQKNAEKVTLTYIDRSSTYAGPTQYDKNATVTVADCTNTRGSYDFVGWDTDASADEVVYEAGDMFAITQNTTLYAVWKAKVVDNGNGISTTKTRASINGDANKTTAEAGDEIKWSVTVTNNSNVEKTVKLTEQLSGAYFVSTNTKEVPIVLTPGESKTLTVAYTVKRTDTGMIINTVAATTGGTGNKENPTATDKGTPVGKTLTVTWIDENGTQLDQKTFVEGDPEPAQTIPNPTKAEDENNTYTFDKWDKTTDGDGNVTYMATYTTTPKAPIKAGTWRLDIAKEISNYYNKGAAVTVDSLPADFAVTVSVTYHNGIERVTETKTLTKDPRNNDSDLSLWWQGVFQLPDWQFDFAGTGKTAADFTEYNTVITITETNYDVSGYTCTMDALAETLSTASDGTTHEMENGAYTVTYPVQQSGGNHTQSRFGLRNSYEAIEHTVTVNHLGDNGHNFWMGWDPTYSLAEGQSYNHSFDETMTALAYPNNSNVMSPKSFSIGEYTYVLDPMANNTPEDELAGTMDKENVVINLYYSRDNKGTINPDGTETSDGIPDKYQATVTYEVENGTWNQGEVTTQVVTFTDANDNYVVPGTKGAIHTDLNVPASSANTGYGPDGTWTATTGNGTVTNNAPTSVTGNATFTIIYAPETYNISYNLDGGIVVGTNPATYTVESDDITLINPTREGYTFAGWTGTGLTGAIADVTIVKGSTGNRAYTATWNANGNTAYKVEHYQQNPDGTYALVETEENLTGATDSMVTATVKAYEGFTHNPAVEGTLLSAAVAGNGSTVLKVYYDRNTYTVSYDLNGGMVDEGVQTQFEGIRHGDTTPTIDDPTRTGYTFTGWTPQVTETVTGTVTYVAQWMPVTFDIDVQVVNGTSDAATVGTTVNYGGDVTYTFTPNDGYIFDSATLDGSPIALSADGTFTLNAVTRGHVLIVTYALAPVDEPDEPTVPVVPTGPTTPMTPTDPTNPTTPGGGTTLPTVTVTPGEGVVPAVATPAAAAAAAAAVEAIGDAENPLADITTIDDDANALAAFEEIHCWTHWLMLFGALVTIVYGLAVLYRRRHDVRDMDDFEGDIMDGGRRYSARRASDPAANGAFQAM